jgi:hypothetical protein
MGWARHVARIGEGRNLYRVLMGKPEGKRQLWRPRRRREDRIKMGLREIGWGVWTGFTWFRIGTVGGLLWMRWWTFGLCRHGFSKTWNMVQTEPVCKMTEAKTVHALMYFWYGCYRFPFLFQARLLASGTILRTFGDAAGEGQSSRFFLMRCGLHGSY